MLKLMAAILWLLAAGPHVDWLAKHAVPIRSVDPADDDFKDLVPLRAALGNVRVVMLGEQSHGDGTTFLAKTRLIRFLHERLGFDVLVFESGFYDCAKAWERLCAGEPARDAVPRGVFAIWTKSREVQPLIDYLGAQANGAHPLELAGADCQFTASASEEFLVHDLAAALGPERAKGEEWERVVRIINLLNQSAWEDRSAPVPSAAEQAAFARTIESWRAAPIAPFWRQFLASFRAYAELDWRTPFPDLTANPAAYALRDRQMGENLLWLARERYPNRKIIVWAATFHSARALRSIEVADAKLARLYAVNAPMGEVAARELGKQLYSIGFTAYEGESARISDKIATPIPAPSRDSLEDLVARAGFTTAFVDLRTAPAWLHAPMPAQFLGHKELRADWTRVVDGVVFIRKMERSHRR